MNVSYPGLCRRLAKRLAPLLLKVVAGSAEKPFRLAIQYPRDFPFPRPKAIPFEAGSSVLIGDRLVPADLDGPQLVELAFRVGALTARERRQ